MAFFRSMTVRGRYAPSPTGRLHVGNAATALLAWLSVRSQGGRFVIRMEDLDRARVVPGSDVAILDDLSWLGLEWDEGPDRGGPHAPYEQSARRRGYDSVFERLRREGRVYPCFCSRKDVAGAASAPQAPGDEVLYPGTCRAIPGDEAARRIDAGFPHSWRFRLDDGAIEGFDDLVRGRVEPEPGTIGDFVVRRADGVPAYQLAVVVDDAAMEITEVVRGGDLLASTSRQLLLYGALALTPPRFGHGPLVLGSDGVRLSKRHRGVTLAELREDGWNARGVVGALAHLLGIRPTREPAAAAELVAGFTLGEIGDTPLLLLNSNGDGKRIL